MRKVDVSHHLGFMLPEESIEKLKSYYGKRVLTSTIANVFKEFHHYDYTIDITIYAEKDIGNPPDTIIFQIEGCRNEPK